MPSNAGVLDPCDYLTPLQCDVFSDLNCVVKPLSEWPEALPRPCHMVSKSDEQILRLAMLKTGMAEIIPEDHVPVDHQNRKLIAGLFGMHHEPGRLRLIVDRRPQNATEDRLCWETLPHGSMLAQLYLDPGQQIRGSGDDLENYFYLLSHKPAWRPRNCFGHVLFGV